MGSKIAVRVKKMFSFCPNSMEKSIRFLPDQVGQVFNLGAKTAQFLINSGHVEKVSPRALKKQKKLNENKPEDEKGEEALIETELEKTE